MNCPNCHELVEEAAVYCGNCGQPLKQPRALGAIGLRGATPSYALAMPWQHTGELQALMSLLCGILGLAGTIFIPILGITLGIAGLVLGTVSRVYSKKVTHFAGLALSSLAILAGLAAWTYAVRHDPRTNSNVARSTPADSSVQVSADLSTPCYSLNFVDELNISNDSKSCDMNAFNGKTIAASTNAYKVYASKSNINNVNDFNNLARGAVEQDMAKSAPDFKISTEKSSTFAGSPSYMIVASDPDGRVSVIESAVMHKVANGNNIFVIVHANNGPVVDLQILESQWQWK